MNRLCALPCSTENVQSIPFDGKLFYIAFAEVFFFYFLMNPVLNVKYQCKPALLKIFNINK